jgi:MerR family mercuric resistance operon transcriptional regulator
LTIGELAGRAGVNIETVRYYERRGLLPEPPRTPAGYRLYGDDALWRLQFVARAKALGFTLAEIRDLLDSTATATADDVLRVAQVKLAEVARKVADLAALQSRLYRLVERCEAGDEFGCVTLDVPVALERTTQ